MFEGCVCEVRVFEVCECVRNPWVTVESVRVGSVCVHECVKSACDI